VDAFAPKARVWDRVVVAPGFECEDVGATAGTDVAQATTRAKEALSLKGMRILGAELGHDVR
jgi:hypothetical protein